MNTFLQHRFKHLAALAAGLLLSLSATAQTVDGTVEADETVTLTVAAGSGYTVGVPARATGTILNDDVPTATITVSPAMVRWPSATCAVQSSGR